MAIHITRDDILIVKGDPRLLKCCPLYIGQICISVNKRQDKLDWFMSYGNSFNDWRSVQYYVNESDKYMTSISQALDKLLYINPEVKFKITGAALESKNLENEISRDPKESMFLSDDATLNIEMGALLDQLDVSWEYNITKKENTILNQYIEVNGERIHDEPPEPNIDNYTYSLTELDISEDSTIELILRDTLYEIEENTNAKPSEDSLVVYKNGDINTVLLTTLLNNNFINIKFLNRCYWGASALTEISEIPKDGFTSILSDDVNRIVTVDADDDKYIYYAVPSRLCDKKVLFNYNCIDGGFNEPKKIELENEFGKKESYNVYRSEWPGLGNTKIKIRQEEI